MNAETMQGHTPGPWAAREMISGNWQIADDANGHTIAHIRDAANAQLIAAAPEMLEALRRLENCPDLNVESLEDVTLDALEYARAAIAKATNA